ncbi:M66 family metalloprotease [Rahnella bonaserana]|jgi:hypothetical protein|uniref:M66 family metalloprotease n=1 Tax=Rahnella bonaserana TaxID=2816248 RepID=UPI00320920E8
MKFNKTLLAIAISMASFSVCASVAPLVFHQQDDSINSLSGALKGQVKFAQTHTIDPSNNSVKEMPRLVSLRDTLFMFIPHSDNKGTKYTIQLTDKNGVSHGPFTLSPPSALPASDKANSADSTHPDVVYSDNAYSVKLPWDLIEPGMIISISDENGLNGQLTEIDVGAENEVMIQNIRLGMLTEPAKLNELEGNSKLAADYFQKIPVSRMIVGNYSPLHLTKVVLSSGKVYDYQSDTTGDVYSGDMREDIAKNLISMGIDNANFGINDSAGSTQWQPAWFNIYAVHNACGFYKNGVVQHGMSGGNGMATLTQTTGNELSHELGHAYGLGHYPGGGMWSTHNQNSGWGWDSFNNRFIANFFWNKNGNVVSQGYTTPPFAGIYRFNNDAMAGGVASSPYSAYTLYTGYSQKRIQSGMEKTGIISEASSSGYLIWNEGKKEMVERNDSSRSKPVKFGVPVTTLVGYYDPAKDVKGYIYPPMTGSYGYVYQPQDVKGGQCWAEVTFADSHKQRYPLAGSRHNASRMNKFHFNVETASNPVSVSVNCPQEDINALYEPWRNEYFGVTKIKNWSADKNGVAGDVYRDVDGRYFKLKHAGYWYYPSGTQSNGDWQYLTNEKTLKELFMAQTGAKSYDSMGVELLDQRTIEPATIEPAPAVVIGKADGFTQVLEQTLLFENNAQLKPHSYATVEAFEKDVRTSYGKSDIKIWSSKGKDSGVPGDLYLYENPHTKTRDYFVLKQNNYWYFPTNQQSTEVWGYIGSATQYVHNDVSPLFAHTNKKLSTEDLLKKYFSRSAILSWSQRNSTTKDREIFVYQNPYNKDKEYFLQRTHNSGHYFPTDKQSNEDWYYIGDEKTLVAMQQLSQAGLEQQLLSWYGKTQFKKWQSNATNNTVGDLYKNPNKGTQDYFMLKTPTYWYFPTNGTSNDQWEYLGSY